MHYRWRSSSYKSTVNRYFPELSFCLNRKVFSRKNIICNSWVTDMAIIWLNMMTGQTKVHVIITARQNDKELIRKLHCYHTGEKITYTYYIQLTCSKWGQCKPHPVKESKKLSDHFTPRKLTERRQKFYLSLTSHFYVHAYLKNFQVVFFYESNTKVLCKSCIVLS